MEEDKTKKLKFNADSQAGDHEANVTFARLIGTLSIIVALKSYEESSKDYKEILAIVLTWATDHIIKKDLSLIDHIELLDVYKKLDDLKGKWLFNFELGEESELSDEVVILMWKLMYLRKFQIEQKG